MDYYLENTKASEGVIIKPGRYKQEIDGFGASFTDSLAYLVHQVLSADQCNDLMKKLFLDGMPVSWKISTAHDAELVNSMLD